MAGSNVVISGGRQVLLDLSPPPLASLTVQNGSLVWDNQTAIELRSGYVLVNDQGSFIIGMWQEGGKKFKRGGGEKGVSSARHSYINDEFIERRQGSGREGVRERERIIIH